MTDIQELCPGDRIVCDGVLNDGSLGLNRSLIGVEGTVTVVGQFLSELTSWVAVDWDNGSTLNVLPGDPIRKLVDADYSMLDDQQALLELQDELTEMEKNDPKLKKIVNDMYDPVTGLLATMERGERHRAARKQVGGRE